MSASDAKCIVVKVGTSVVSRPDGSLAITYKFGEASVADMIETYRASGQRIADLRTEEPDLEDVFLALTYQVDAKQSA